MASHAKRSERPDTARRKPPSAARRGGDGGDDAPGRSLGAEIVLHRRLRKMSQAALAHRLGVHQQTVSRWEVSGAVPSPGRVMALEDVFDLDRGVLLRLADYVPGPGVPEARIALPRLLSALTALADEELVVLIDSAWQIHRERVRGSSAARTAEARIVDRPKRGGSTRASRPHPT